MYRAATLLALTLMTPISLPSLTQAATPEQQCRKDVNKNVAKYYAEVLKLSSKCFKTRIKTPGNTTDCLDPVAFDPRDKLGGKTAALVVTMGLQSSNCSSFGPQYTAACHNAPPACTVECTGCTTGEEAAACMACQVTGFALVQLDALYGNPPDLSADKDAAKCQATIGKEASKYARTRLKEQQKCQQAVGNDKLRVNCSNADLKGKIARGSAKLSAKTVKKCLTSPGVDQVPDLDTSAVCLGTDTAAAANCAVTATDATVGAVFALASRPAALRGVVMGMGPAGDLLPLPGVRIEITGASLGAFTDNNGAYRLEAVPPGNQTIVIDAQRVGSYPRIPMGVTIPMVGEESLGIFTMPEVDMANAVDITSISTANPDGSRVLTSPLILANPTVPGATLDLPAGTTITFDVPNRAPLLSVSVVPFAVMPFPGGGVFSDDIFSFQPEGAMISPAANLTLPNNTGLANGASVDIYIPDFSTNTFLTPGSGTVTTGGTLVESDSPIVDRFDWHFVATPPTGCTTDVIGRVVDGTAFLPVVGADVLVAGATAVTGPLGTFSFPSLSCPAFVRADASALNTSTGKVNTSTNAVPTVFFGTTDVGDLELLETDCPNGVLDLGEDCDDGNQILGDGCTAFCIEEFCGNVIIDPGEECDGTLGCSDFCTLCGDGVLRIPGEECDEGPVNGQVGSTCSSTCRTTVCGNGLLEETEECDFGSANGGALGFCQIDCRLKPSTQGGGSSLVRAFDGCTLPNTNTTAEFVPACQPPSAPSAFQFGPSATGELNFGLVAGGADALISASLGDVRDGAGVAITDASGWQLTASVRVTLRAPTAALPDITLEDITIGAPLALGAAGQLSGSASVATGVGVDFSDFGQHNVQILDVAVIDPSGAEFANPGFLLDPTQSLTVNAPTQAKGGTVELARYFDACTAPNVAASGGALLNACTPPTTPSAWTFAAGGNAAFTYQTAGNDLSLAVSLDSLLDQSAAPAVGQVSLLSMQRFTVLDPGGEMTLIDFPLGVTVPLVGGKGVRSTTLSTIWLNLFGPGGAFPASAQGSLAADVDTSGVPTEIGLAPTLFDDVGNRFAQLGMRDTGP